MEEENLEVTEIYCHECGGYVTIKLNLSLNGNHVVNCPKCNHEHCRVIKDGKVTDDRWDSRNGPAITYSVSLSQNYSTNSVYVTSSSLGMLGQAWLDNAGTSGYGTSSFTVTYYT
jgi:hypothetical protein